MNLEAQMNKNFPQNVFPVVVDDYARREGRLPQLRGVNLLRAETPAVSAVLALITVGEDGVLRSSLALTLFEGDHCTEGNSRGLPLSS